MIGFNEALYILPFDHRGWFQTKMFGWTGTLSSSQTAEVASTNLGGSLHRRGLRHGPTARQHCHHPTSYRLN